MKRALIAALAAVMLLPGGAMAQEDPPTQDETGELFPEIQDAIGAAWLDELNGFYASGDPADLPSTTEQGLERLRAFDWRFAVAESGLATFHETWDIHESTQSDLAIVDGETVDFELRLGIDVERLAETKTGTSDRTVEMTDGVQRRAFNVTFVQGPTPGTWLLDAIGEPAGGRYEFSFRELRPARPCPRLGNSSTARDPFTMEPWCTAGGDGRHLKVAPYKRKDRYASDLYFATKSCGWDAAIFLYLGWPPGEPKDIHSGFENIYVRDPRSEVPGVKRYRRDAKLPKDAVSTGVTNGYATIWTSETVGERAIFVQVGDRIERWPQDTSVGCTGN